MMGKINHRNRRAKAGQKRRDGAVLVEFALVLPVFFMILLTCLEFTRLNMIRNLMQDAAYYAARHCIVPGATAEEAEAEANRILAAMGTRDASITINDGNGLNENSPAIKVQITVPIASNAFVASQFTQEMTLVAESVMKTERYDGFYDPNQ